MLRSAYLRTRIANGAALAAALVFGLAAGVPGQGTSAADRVVAWRPDHSFGAAPTGAAFTDPASALGVPDFNSSAGTGAVSLGGGGQLILAFIDNHLSNDGGGGDDLQVSEVHGAAEPYGVAVRPADAATASALQNHAPPYSPDSQGFFQLGSDDGGVALLDVDSVFTGFAPDTLRFNAVRITDSTPGAPPSASAGADIDAVVALRSIFPHHQTNSPGAGLTFGGHDDLRYPLAVRTSAEVTPALRLTVSGAAHQPFILGWAPSGVVSGAGLFFPGGGFVDLDFQNGLFILLDGTGLVLGGADPLAFTGASGAVHFDIPLPSGLAADLFAGALQAVVADPSSTSGFSLTSATVITLTPPPSHGIVYVSTDGASSNAGTSTAPLRLLSEGVLRAQQNGATEVRAAAGTYDESGATPNFVSGISITGGCNPLLWQPKAGAWSVVLVPATGALVQNVAASTDLSGLDLRSADASAAGSSSTALRAANCTSALALRNCRLRAGAGAAAAAGAHGGVSQATCSGGSGGAGSTQLGGLGDTGTAGSACGGGAGGPGGGGGPSALVACLAMNGENGGSGLPGQDGAHGQPGAAAGPGATTGSGWTPGDGSSGSDGNSGGGGGGGGGGGAGCCLLTVLSGGSGGAGGNGGGAGLGGQGGAGGGGSFALFLASSQPQLSDCLLRATQGGTGGAGGNGGIGAAGSAGSPGQDGQVGSSACVTQPHGGRGGDGGSGGAGGGGGGGSGGEGGPGLTLLRHQSGPVNADAFTSLIAGSGSAGGTGGIGADQTPAPAGPAGTSGTGN